MPKDADRAERVTITLPPDMLATIKRKVQDGVYGSTSEVIREAMRYWQHHEEEREIRLALIRARLEQSANSGQPVPLKEAFDRIEQLHRERNGDQ